MKRLVFASLISLLALSAQAVTIDWGKATSGQAEHAYTNQTSANHLSNKLNSAEVWTVGAVLTVKGDIGTLTSWPSIIGVTKTSDSDSAFRFVLNNGTAGTVGISTPGSVVSASGDPVTLETGKSYEFVISIARITRSPSTSMASSTAPRRSMRPSPTSSGASKGKIAIVCGRATARMPSRWMSTTRRKAITRL